MKLYFIAPEALLAIELMADDADIAAEDAASIADVAADEAAMLAEAAMSDADDAGAIVAGGVVVIVVVSSFLVQAAKVTAAASVAINRAVLMFLLDLGSDNYRQLWEPSWRRPPSFEGKESSCIRCLADDYRQP